MDFFIYETWILTKFKIFYIYELIKKKYFSSVSFDDSGFTSFHTMHNK